MFNLNYVKEKDPEREELARQVEAFLKKGGQITEEPIVEREYRKERIGQRERRGFTVNPERKGRRKGKA